MDIEANVMILLIRFNVIQILFNLVKLNLKCKILTTQAMIVQMATRLVEHIFPIRHVEAHCDIPCGIYDPHDAQISALTIIRMNQLIQDLDTKDTDPGTYNSKLSRYVTVKEEHAERCKRELRILWGDYFKPEHLEKHKDLHDLFWKAMKLASKTRQENDIQTSQELLGTVQRIAEVFWETKGADIRRQPSLQAAGGELVYPVAKA